MGCFPNIVSQEWSLMLLLLAATTELRAGDSHWGVSAMCGPQDVKECKMMRCVFTLPTRESPESQGTAM